MCKPKRKPQSLVNRASWQRSFVVLCWNQTWLRTLLWLSIVIIGANSAKPINPLETIQKAFVVHWINCKTKHFRFYPTFYPIATTVKFCLYLAGFELTTIEKWLDKRQFLSHKKRKFSFNLLIIIYSLRQDHFILNTLLAPPICFC